MRDRKNIIEQGEYLQEVDLIIFMGQSNMAGRGEADKAPICPKEAGEEYRAVSAPDRLFPVREPFGLEENNRFKINDEKKKCGSMVSAFITEYYRLTGRRVIAVSASEGGTSSQEWRNCLVFDAEERFCSAVNYLKSHGISIRKKIMFWCQGETDGDRDTPTDTYIDNTLAVYETMKKRGIEKCYLIQIGHYNYVDYPSGSMGVSSQELEKRYKRIRKAQEKLCRENPEIEMVASFEGCLDEMKDNYHYYQSAYNRIGTDTARYISESYFSNPY